MERLAKVPIRLTLAAGLVFLARSGPAAAQAMLRAETVVSGRYVWHGISRSAGLGFHPSMAVGIRSLGLNFAAGGAAHYELDRVTPGELSEAGTGRSLGEGDIWASVATKPGPVRIEATVARYLFQGQPGRGGLGRDRNTTELGFSIGIPLQTLVSSVEIWRDVGRVKGYYFSAKGRVPVLAWPFKPFVFLHLDVETGLNFGQEPNRSHPTELANFGSRGLTHTALGVTADVRSFPWPGHGFGTLRAGLRTQLNFDDGTRANGAGRTSDWVTWGWFGAAVALGGDARRVR